jgi:hypothetical protein
VAREPGARIHGTARNHALDYALLVWRLRIAGNNEIDRIAVAWWYEGGSTAIAHETQNQVGTMTKRIRRVFSLVALLGFSLSAPACIVVLPTSAMPHPMWPRQPTVILLDSAGVASPVPAPGPEAE